MNKKIGILIGRFQTPELTEGQFNILNNFLNEDYDFYGIILGIPATKASANNPLDFDSRRRMIESEYPGRFQFGYVKDESSDFVWSNQLDKAINLLVKCSGEIVIHGTKEVLAKYFGNAKVVEINNDIINSMKFKKEFVSKKVNDPSSWRAGACWSASNRYPVAYHTVDCAIFDDLSLKYVWMAKKQNEDKLRFIGGFVDPQDSSAEGAAMREALEETNMNCSILGYISSRKIDDWRYREEEDKIITTLYALIRKNGNPGASDDICELYKVDILSLDERNVMPEHHQLLKDVKNWVNTKQIFKEHALM